MKESSILFILSVLFHKLRQYHFPYIFLKLVFQFQVLDLAYKQSQRGKGEIAEKANVKQFRLHDFRHSCTSLLVNNQGPITIVSSFMGHSNTTETLKTYFHLFKGKFNETMDIINNLNK